jgi:hypothetical protein
MLAGSSPVDLSSNERLQLGPDADPKITQGTAMPQLFEQDRLDVWYDGSAICVIAVGSHGDPLDLSESEVEALIAKLQESLKKACS